MFFKIQQNFSITKLRMRVRNKRPKENVASYYHTIDFLIKLEKTCQINLSNVTFGWHQRSQLVICKSHPSKTADGCNVQLILRNRCQLRLLKWTKLLITVQVAQQKEMKTFGLEKLLEALLLIPINAFLDAIALGMFNFWLWILNYFKSSVLTYLDWKQIFLKPRGNSGSIFFPTFFFLRLLSVYGELNSCFLEMSARKCYKPRWTEWRPQLRKLFNVDF